MTHTTLTSLCHFICMVGWSDCCRWAWQNTDHCRHANLDGPPAAQLEADDAPASGQPKKKSSSRRGLSLKLVMSRLHLLLHSKYFRSWPLELRFFSLDVHRKWEQESSREDRLLSDTIKVIVYINPDLHPNTSGSRSAIDERGTIDGLDLSNKGLDSYREKAAFLLDDGEDFDCGVCKGSLRLKDDLILVCPQELCKCASHLMCLASTFLDDERIRDEIIPPEGECPACNSTVEWSTLIRELSLRTRGQKAKTGCKPGTVTENQGLALAEYEANADPGRELNSLKYGMDRVTGGPTWDEAECEDYGYIGRREMYGSNEMREFWLPAVPEKENANTAYRKPVPRRRANDCDWDDVVVVE